MARPVDFISSLDSPRGVVIGWVQSATLASVALLLTDLVVGGTWPGALGLLQGIGLSATAGLLAGALLGGLMAGLAGVERRWVWSASVLAAGLAFSGLADGLGAFKSLGGRHHVLALQVIVLCAVATVGFGALTALIQPSVISETWLAKRSGKWRMGALLLLLVGALVLAIADRNLFQGSYQLGHRALRLASWYLVLLGVFVLGRRFSFRAARHAQIIAGALGCLCLLPFVSLTERDTPEAAALVGRPLAGMHLEMLRDVTDVDRDGHSSLLGGGDCSALNPAVSPGAREIFDNGIDENCSGNDATRVQSVPLEQIPVSSEPAPADVVLITVDTLRADRLSLYGHKRPTTPNLEEFAKNATVFDAAYTTGGWTSLAVPSLMRGLYPRRLDWILMIETTKYRYFRPPLAGKLAKGEKSRARFILPVDDKHSTIAELLQHRGMTTAAVVDGGFTEILAKKWGAGVGFDSFEEVRLRPRRLRNDAGTTELAIRALRRLRQAGKPFFLWVHYFGPHAPSEIHRGIPQFGDQEVDKYDHEIVYMDRHVGRLLKAIEKKGERPTEIVFTSDHGEKVHNSETRGHGADFSDDTLRVPMLVKSASLRPGRVASLVSNVDVVPTILAMTKSSGPPRLDGVDLATYVPGSKKAKLENDDRVVFAETFELTQTAGAESFQTDLLVAVQEHRKLVLDRVRQTTTHRKRTGKSSGVSDPPSKSIRLQTKTYLEETGGTPRIDQGPGGD